MPRALICCLLALLLASACGSADDSVPVTLEVMLADDWAGTDPVLDVVREFERSHPRVQVNLVSRPFSQLGEELVASVTAGRPIDVVQHHAFAAGAQGVAEPLEDLWADRLEVEDYFSGAVADVTWDGIRYGVPLDINAMLLIMDGDLAAEHGRPTTFGEVAELAEQATEGTARGMTISSDSWQVYGWIRANGGEVVEVAADGTPTFTLDRQENIEALDFLGEMVADEHAFGPTGRNLDSGAYSLFVTRETVLMTSGTWDTAQLQADHPERAFAAVAMPGGTDGTTQGTAQGGSSLMIGRDAPHRELAAEFILALTEDEVALQLANTEGRLPPKPEVMADADLGPELADLVDEQIQHAHPMMLLAFPEAQEAFARAIDDVLTGRQPAAEALRTAQVAAEESLGS